MSEKPLLTRKVDEMARMPFHPFLAAAYPVLALLASNIGQVDLVNALRSLAFNMVLSLLIIGIHYLLLRDLRRASIASSVGLLLFFSYGHFYGEIEGMSVFGLLLGRHRFLLPTLVGLYLAVLSKVWKDQDGSKATPMINVALLFLCAIPMVSILQGQFTFQAVAPPSWELVEDSTPVRSESQGDFPDIYYIVPDSYLRADILSDQYGFENSEFLHFLEENGFYVATESRANYMWTHQSLSSSMNMAYIHELIGGEDPGRGINPQLHVKNGLVRQELERRGYKTVGFVTGWPGSAWLEADVVLRPDMTTIEGLQRVGALNEFEAQLLYLTPARILLELDQAEKMPVTQYLRGQFDRQYDLHREIILAEFENLRLVPRIEGPKFVFVHILAPHSPYVFEKDGSPVDHDEPFTLADNEELALEGKKHRYLAQLQFTNTKLAEAIEYILAESRRPVRIILQADHGFGADLDWDAVEWRELHARMSILNAYYFSPECQRNLYPEITPVNSFRLLLNCDLGGDYELLEDEVYIGYDSFVPLARYLEIRDIER